MGRTIYIYTLDYRVIQDNLFSHNSKRELVELVNLYAAEYDFLNPSALIERLEQNPRELSLDDFELLIMSLSDFDELADSNTLIEGLNRMAQSGITEIFATTATNPSCVFMELFRGFLEEHQPLAAGDDRYRISGSQFNLFLEKLIIITKVFLEKAHGEHYPYKADPAGEEHFTREAEEIYSQEIEKKVRLGDEIYSQKWGANYFDFAWNCGSFIELKRKSFMDDVLIFDSY